MDSSLTNILTAQIAPLSAGDLRQVRRRVVDSSALIDAQVADPSPVQVLDLSEAGFRIRTNASLEAGSSFLIKFSGAAALRATVMWCSNGEAGCSFESHVHPADLEQLIASATPKRRIVRPGTVMFGRR
jgi:hypothetical protein